MPHSLLQAGPELDCLDTVDSTSLEMRRRLEGLAQGDTLPNGTAVLARKQTKGRGRLDRVWHCAPGDGLTASFWLRLNLPVTAVAGFSLLPSLAVLDILHELQDTDNRAGCKWPNDIRVDGRKLCGILTECVSETDGRIRGAIVGVGLNLRSAPPADHPDTLPPVALAELVAGPLDPEFLTRKLCAALMRRTEQWCAGQRPALLREWLEHCDHQNARLRVTINGQKQWCHMHGLGPHGQLLVRMNNALHEVWADEIEPSSGQHV